MVDLTDASSRIKLRLNSDEKPSAAIVETIKEIDALFDPYNTPQKPQKIDDLQIQLVSQGRIVLKEEWERVKRGERTFVVAKRASLFILIVAVLGAFWLVLPVIRAKFHL